MLLLLFLSAVLLAGSEAFGACPAAPVVSAVWAQQVVSNNGKVYVHYKVAYSGGPVFVSLWCSTDGGQTYSRHCESVTGSIGLVSPGSSSKTLWWDARADVPGFVGANCRIRVVATGAQ